MSSQYFIRHDLDERVIRFNKVKMEIKLGVFKKPSYFSSYDEALSVVLFLNKFCDEESNMDSRYLSVVEV